MLRNQYQFHKSPLPEFIRTIGMVWRELSLPSKIYLFHRVTFRVGERRYLGSSKLRAHALPVTGHTSQAAWLSGMGEIWNRKNGHDLVKGWTTELEFFK